MWKVKWGIHHVQIHKHDWQAYVALTLCTCTLTRKTTLILQVGQWGRSLGGGGVVAIEGPEAGVLSPSFVNWQLLPIDSDCGLPIHSAKVQKHSGPSPLSGKCERASVPHVCRAVTCLEDACAHTETYFTAQQHKGKNIGVCLRYQ